ncbi:MAG: Yip1 family protein [Pseudomonadota bacterium]
MNIMMFPHMFSSHDAGWAWLSRMHPSVVKTFWFYVLPLSLLPPAMLLYAASEHGTLLFSNMSMAEAWLLALLFLLVELLMVPLMAAVIQVIGASAHVRPDYHDAFVFAAVAPTPLWLSALALFVPGVLFNGIVSVLALCASGMLIYEGSYRLFKMRGRRRPTALAFAILAAGLLAWVSLMGIAYRIVGWLA